LHLHVRPGRISLVSIHHHFALFVSLQQQP
jgi:hypothetical protein